MSNHSFVFAKNNHRNGQFTDIQEKKKNVERCNCLPPEGTWYLKSIAGA